MGTKRGRQKSHTQGDECGVTSAIRRPGKLWGTDRAVKGSSVKNINFSFNSGYKSKYQKEPKCAENTTWLPCKHMFLLLLEWPAALFLRLKKVQQGKFGGWKGWHTFSKAGLIRVVCSLGWKGTEGLGTPWGLPRACRNNSKTSGSDCRLCPASRTREVSAHFYRARLQMA